MKYIAAGVMIFAIAACGFQPLYVEREGDSVWHYDGKYNTTIIQEMAKVKVEPIADRFGQIIRNEILDSLTPKGEPSSPDYRLYVSLQEKDVVQQALRKDVTATRERVKYVVTYKLVRASDAETLVNGDSVAFVSYDIMANPYSTTMAQKKTEENAAKMVANDIILRIGTYFHSKLVETEGYGDI